MSGCDVPDRLKQTFSLHKFRAVRYGRGKRGMHAAHACVRVTEPATAATPPSHRVARWRGATVPSPSRERARKEPQTDRVCTYLLTSSYLLVSSHAFFHAATGGEAIFSDQFLSLRNWLAGSERQKCMQFV